MGRIKNLLLASAILCQLHTCYPEDQSPAAEALENSNNGDSKVPKTSNSSSTTPGVRTLSTSSEIIRSSASHFYYAVGVENTTLFYVECEPPNKNVRECRLLFGSNSFANNTEWAPCGFQMKVNASSPKTATYMRVYRFGASKILVLWIEYGGKPTPVTHVDGKIVTVGIYVRFVVIDRPTCRADQFSTLGSSHTFHYSQIQNTIEVHLSDHLFDIVYAYESGQKLARERFNSEGERLAGPMSATDPKIGPELLHVTTVTDPPGLDRTFSCFQIWPQERLRSGPGWGPNEYLSELDSGALVGWSTANGYIGYCEKAELGVHKKPGHESDWACEQLRPKSNSIVRTFWLWFEYKPRAAMIYNMPEGGFLTVTSQQQSGNTYGGNQTLWLTRFGHDNKVYKPIEFLSLDCRHSSMLLGHFFKDADSGDFCFALLPDKHLSNFIVKCYPEQVLSQGRT